MVCEHLINLDQELSSSFANETSRGKAWTNNCREWVYYDVVLDISSLENRFNFSSCIEIQENNDPRSGLEKGFVCKTCNDAIMGLVSGDNVFK